MFSRNISILVAGIDNAGKTTVVHGIIGEAFDTVAPTLGFSSEVFSSGKQWKVSLPSSST